MFYIQNIQFLRILVVFVIDVLLYVVTVLPEICRSLLYLNPLTSVVEQTHDVLFWVKAQNLEMLSFYWLITLILDWVEFVWFQKTRKGLTDVLRNCH